MSEKVKEVTAEKALPKITLHCTGCGRTYALSNSLNCAVCGGILLVEYDRRVQYVPSAPAAGLSSIWRYRDMLPQVKTQNIVSLGEGNTPLSPSRHHASLYFKDEGRNPTGSFKDRPTSVCITMAKEFGCSSIVTASSGNGAASASCYASVCGLASTIFVPAATPAAKVAQAISYGGNVIRVEGDFSRSFEMAKHAAHDTGVMNVTTTFLNPFGVEGDKTIAYEIYEQLGRCPDTICIPVGAGPIVVGVYRGFRDICSVFQEEKMPKIIAVQAEGCAPIVRALQNSRPVRSERNPKTIAGAISDPLHGYEQDGDLAAEVIVQSGGTGVLVSDEQIISAGLLLARKEGMFVEPSSAAAYAGYLNILDEGDIDLSGMTVCILTGNGLKESSAYVDASAETSCTGTGRSRTDQWRTQGIC